MHARRKEMEGSRGEWRVLLAAALVVASVTLLGAEDVTTSAPIEFQLASTYDAPGVKSGTLLEATGDETLDLVLATGGAYAFLEGGGDGTFQQRSVTRTRNSTGWGLHDFNGDGLMDLFLSQDGPDVLLSNGDGTFQQVELGLEGEGVVRTALFADYDGDSAADVYLSTSAFSQTHAWNRLHPVSRMARSGKTSSTRFSSQRSPISGTHTPTVQKAARASGQPSSSKVRSSAISTAMASPISWRPPMRTEAIKILTVNDGPRDGSRSSSAGSSFSTILLSLT